MQQRGESLSSFMNRKAKWKNFLPLTGRSVLISVRRHAANTHTHIKLTCKKQRKRRKREVSIEYHIFYTPFASSFNSGKQCSFERFQNLKTSSCSLFINKSVALVSFLEAHQQKSNKCAQLAENHYCVILDGAWINKILQYEDYIHCRGVVNVWCKAPQLWAKELQWHSAISLWF